jgi:hypothetical protein
MTNQHPITPPPELVQQWHDECYKVHEPFLVHIANQAARWGADQELEECWRWMRDEGYRETAQLLHAARRPQPTTLKEQALEALETMPKLVGFESERDTIFRAIEALNNDTVP